MTGMAARTIVKFVRECRDRGKTVVYSTHIMSEVEKLCDTIGIIPGHPPATLSVPLTSN